MIDKGSPQISADLEKLFEGFKHSCIPHFVPVCWFIVSCVISREYVGFKIGFIVLDLENTPCLEYTSNRVTSLKEKCLKNTLGQKIVQSTMQKLFYICLLSNVSARVENYLNFVLLPLYTK